MDASARLWLPLSHKSMNYWWRMKVIQRNWIRNIFIFASDGFSVVSYRVLSLSLSSLIILKGSLLFLCKDKSCFFANKRIYVFFIKRGHLRLACFLHLSFRQRMPFLFICKYFKLGLWDTCYCYKWGHGILPLLFECPVWNAHFWKSKADLTKKSWNETKASFFPTLDSKQIYVIIRA